MARPETKRTPNGTPAPTPISIDLLDGDDGLGEGVAKVGRVLGSIEDVELLDSAGRSLANVVEGVEMLEETIDSDDVAADKCDAELEPLTSAWGKKKDPGSPSEKFDVLQQLVRLASSNTFASQQKFSVKVPLTEGQGSILL